MSEEDSVNNLDLGPQSETFMDPLKESISVTRLYGLSADDYLDQVDSIFSERLCEGLNRLTKYMAEKFPQIDIKQIDKFIEQLYENFEDHKTTQMLGLEDFVAQCIFRVPKNMTLPADEPISESLKHYSAEEDEKLDKCIEELQKSIQSKKSYASILSKNLIVSDFAINNINTNAEILKRAETNNSSKITKK